MNTLDAEQLIEAGRELAAPFCMEVIRDSQTRTLTVQQIFRLLPGKRIVALAECCGEQLLIKTYIGRTATKYMARERNGVNLIADAGVRTPSLLWHGQLADGRGHILAFEYLESAVSLFDSWQTAEGYDEQVAILTRAMQIIARLHNVGVVQDDLHLANFLMADNRLYTIDGGGISRRSEPPLPRSHSLNNLGLFFAQFFPTFDEMVRVVFPAYEAIRGWGADASRLPELRREILRNRENRKRNYLDKVFRDCTRFLCRSSLKEFMVCERSEYNAELEELLADPDRFIDNAEILKNGNTTTVALVNLSDRALVIKRYNIKDAVHGLKRALRKSRAWHSWSNAFRMEFLGIRSLKPVAMIENRLGPIRRTAYFISEYIPGPDALECLQGLDNPDKEMRALAEVLQQLCKSRISHGDLKATNFVMAEDGPVIIDLDAMEEYRDHQQFVRAFNKDLNRFMANWDDRPEIASHFSGLLADLPLQARSH
ncbi:MAG: serine/threonine protein kinase [Pseudomonadales bacterium]|nr:serine/threonine protein kinase [Pseudomonadales bacterium]